ncbi:MAG TPA: hypothetical protein VHO25_16105 [Polyangiaceae bacterium]|nr:hypothetical protein [Polyangiaceae bacterium]
MILGIGCTVEEDPAYVNVGSGGMPNAGSGGAGGGGAGTGGGGMGVSGMGGTLVDCHGGLTCEDGVVRATTNTSVTYPQACPEGEVVYQCLEGCREDDVPQSEPPQARCAEFVGLPGSDAGDDGGVDSGADAATDAGLQDSGAADADAAD